MTEDNDDLVKQAREALDRGDFDVAIDLCTREIEQNPDRAEAYYIRGNACYKKGEYDLAIADYSEAIEMESDYAYAYYNRGNAHDKKGAYDLAFKDYSEAIALDPGFAEAYDNRGNAYAAKGEYDLAIADYSKAIALDPDNAETYSNRGSVYGMKEEYDLALADHNKAFELDPYNAIAYRNLALEAARQSAQAIAGAYASEYEEQFGERLDQFVERLEREISSLVEPRKVVSRFEARENRYTEQVESLDEKIWQTACRVVVFFLVVPVVPFWAIARYEKWFLLPFLSALLALVAYPLFSQLRHLREKRNRFEVCREDYFRKGVIAEYILIAGIGDSDRRQDAIAKFQSHLANRSSAEFLSDGGSSSEGDDG
ncbi:MAG: tetratricopeptide repeat protein [Alphaproteobacteria bacterium]|nr:tetratricopeptide repeat protein [Alphaproteobacteria bacterium]MDA8003878.1 tetratricopeptide repeat protein [Alphaproteobacteria bacterium]MDA8005841.1 tetratricopeptide repeat protein [Alphaproteobacteria bacterium]MDA8013248.1 tetratricopeptide repeat protein [Alphaproteobacteria bacterium]